MTSSDDFGDLGSFLHAEEARGLAAHLGAGAHLSHALNEVSSGRRQTAKALLESAGLGHGDPERSVAVLRAIAGAKGTIRDTTPVWTMPGNEANIGHLTGEFHRLVEAARQSITCATYNFETTSKMWDVLKVASERPEMSVVVYVDGQKADSDKLRAQMPKATIYRSGTLPDGKQIVSHAKFVIIDHSIVLLTSANFSYSAEKQNVELGLLIEDAALATSIEATMASKHGSLYELV